MIPHDIAAQIHCKTCMVMLEVTWEAVENARFDLVKRFLDDHKGHVTKAYMRREDVPDVGT